MTSSDQKKVGASVYGPATFAKAPLVDVDDEWSADVAILGIPFDLGVGFRSGTRWGSKAIRDFSVRFCSLSSDEPGYWDIRTGRERGRLSFVDCGDVDVVQLDWEQNFDKITRSVKTILAHGALPVLLGGDHSITYPIVRAYEGQEPITIVHVDAHLDYRDENYGGIRYGHGNVLRRARELPFVKHLVSLGIRGLRVREVDHKANQADGNVIVPAHEIHARGVDAFESVLPKDERVYITFDIDSLDPAYAPGTGTPEVGGLHYEQARRILEIVCGRNRLVGFDLVEVNPLYDPTEITGLMAAQVIVEAVAFAHDR